MVKFDADIIRYITREEFRVLVAVEMGMHRNYYYYYYYYSFFSLRSPHSLTPIILLKA